MALPQPYGSPPASSSLWSRIWRSPDPALVDAGLRGEWLVASIRLLIVILLLYFPLRIYVGAPLETRGHLALWVGVAALAEALIVYSAVRRSWGRGWIGFFSGFVDVSLVSLALWIHVRLGNPELAISDLFVFPLYLLAIGATTLRYDWRICALTGAGAIGEYGGIVGWVASYIGRESIEPLLVPQIGRFLVLVLASALATTLVVRTHELRHLSTRDRLTGLANRGFFEESLRNIGALASRSGDPVAVVMLDVDHFKRFNDTWGHLAGDDCLRSVAHILGTSFRSTDLVARYGGEEFSCLLPGMDPANAERRMNEIRESLAESRIELPGRIHRPSITVSVGIAIWPFDGDDLSAALAVADERLYAAKNSGRNRVVAGPTDT